MPKGTPQGQVAETDATAAVLLHAQVREEVEGIFECPETVPVVKMDARRTDLDPVAGIADRRGDIPIRRRDPQRGPTRLARRAAADPQTRGAGGSIARRFLRVGLEPRSQLGSESGEAAQLGLGEVGPDVLDRSLAAGSQGVEAAGSGAGQ